jgi:ethanolaminephosphotransferase
VHFVVSNGEDARVYMLAHNEQGNSNHLGSVDVSRGYIGMTEYSPVLVGALLAAGTYAGPITVVCASCCAPLDRRKRVSSVWVCARSLATVTSLCMTVFLRHHLFVWSVFAPKLLFDIVHHCVFVVICFFDCVLTYIFQ